MGIYIILIIFFAGLTIYAFASRKKFNNDIEQKITHFQEIQEKLINQNNDLHAKNSVLESTNIGLYKEKENIETSIKNLQDEKYNLNSNVDFLKEEALSWQSKALQAKAELNASQSAIKTNAIAQEELTKKAFISYCETLDSAYAQAEEEYDLKLLKLSDNIQQEQKQLDEIVATRVAAHQALLKEKEIKENKDNYCLKPTIYELDDIHHLERVKKDLHNTRILSMLIWQTYWQKLAKIRFPQILQDKTKTGIYKITNIQTDECYIGQSVDIYKRWCEHCKCGLGIDTPPGNKLYKAIQEYGLENFTFELLTECTKEELNAKEKYFIELYQAKDFGYNGNEGINK